MIKIDQFLLRWPKKVVRRVDLQNNLGLSGNPLNQCIKRAVNSKKVSRLKHGIYVISEPYNMQTLNNYEAAQWLYGTSYISFESALSFYGLIPESVYTITSATTKRSAEFETDVGKFAFVKVPKKKFLLNVSRLEQETGTYYIAKPFKALADLIFEKKKIWKTQLDLEADMRIEIVELKKLPIEDLDNVILTYANVRVVAQLKRIRKWMQRGN